MRIGELADRAGLSTKAIRYYEDIGVLPQPERQANGYRSYGNAAENRLGFGAHQARQLGLDPNNGFGKVVTVGSDFAYSVLLDPFLFVGKVSKARRLARWAIGSADTTQDVFWFQDAARAAAARQAGHLDEAAKILADMELRSATRLLADNAGGFFGGGRDDDALDSAAPPDAESDPQGGSARLDSRYR